MTRVENTKPEGLQKPPAPPAPPTPSALSKATDQPRDENFSLSDHVQLMALYKYDKPVGDGIDSQEYRLFSMTSTEPIHEVQTRIAQAVYGKDATIEDLYKTGGTIRILGVE